MADHAIKEVIVNIEKVLQIPRCRIENFYIPSDWLCFERDNMKFSHNRTKIDQQQEGHS